MVRYSLCLWNVNNVLHEGWCEERYLQTTSRSSNIHTKLHETVIDNSFLPSDAS